MLLQHEHTLARMHTHKTYTRTHEQGFQPFQILSSVESISGSPEQRETEPHGAQELSAAAPQLPLIQSLMSLLQKCIRVFSAEAMT